MNMSNNERILQEIETYDTGKLSEFLEANGLEEFIQVVQIKNIDGPQFVTLKEYQILSWKPHITLQQVRTLWAFLMDFKKNPEKYTIPKWKLPRPNITRQQLENLCNNEQIINKLQNLLQERDLQQSTVNQDSDNQESFSSEDEDYANHETVKNLIANTSTLHKLRFKDPTEALKPMTTKLTQKFDATLDTESEEIYENASNLPQPKSNPVKDISARKLFQKKTERETDEIYENTLSRQSKKEIEIPNLPRPPIPKSLKIQKPENLKFISDIQVLPRPPLPKSIKPHNEVDSRKNIPEKPTSAPKFLPQIPQNKQNQPLIPSRSTKPDQSKSAIPIIKNNTQFLEARSHLQNMFSGRLSPQKEEHDEYLEPNPVEEEQMYEEPEHNFQEKQPEKKVPRPGAIQTLPLPPLPVKSDLKSPILKSATRPADKREIQSRALPKPPIDDFKQAPEVSTLPRPPKNLLNFNSHLNTKDRNEAESLLCYRNTDRDGSENLLTEDLGDGAYLIRPSKQYYSTLSVRCESKIYHIGIKQNKDGQLECLSSGRQILFNNLNEICQHFKQNPLRMIDNYNNYKSILLRDVLPRERK